MRPSTMARVALMAALTAVGAQIAIPLPFTPVPFTFQVPMVVLSGLLLGARLGGGAQLIYLLLGAVGVPVFAGFTGGLAHIVGPTGGYLLSYPIAAAVAGLAAGTVAGGPRARATITAAVSGLIGLTVIYALGATWLAFQSGLSPTAALAAGVLPFVPFDVAKVILAALLAVAVAPHVVPVRGPVRRPMSGRGAPTGPKTSRTRT